MATRETVSNKRKAGLIFTANTTSVTTWLGCPPIDRETARIEISRDMAAKMLRESRNKARLPAPSTKERED